MAIVAVRTIPIRSDLTSASQLTINPPPLNGTGDDKLTRWRRQKHKKNNNNGVKYGYIHVRGLCGRLFPYLILWCFFPVPGALCVVSNLAANNRRQTPAQTRRTHNAPSGALKQWAEVSEIRSELHEYHVHLFHLFQEGEVTHAFSHCVTLVAISCYIQTGF